jgi:hypothetical protein
MDPKENDKLDPEPHQNGKQDPDPDPHQNDKQDPDPHQSEIRVLEIYFKWTHYR